ncbi:MAG: hypothetical protein LQ341_001192 [Variospora aurantia]|nr:MAG: hypothetical protein LQ341_001192 [Variospora aurantia]
MAGEQGEFRQQRETARSERIRRRDQTSEAVESEASTEPSIEELEVELVQHENQFWARPHDDLGQHANDTDYDSGDDEDEDGAGTSGVGDTLFQDVESRALSAAVVQGMAESIISPPSSESTSGLATHVSKRVIYHCREQNMAV